MKRLLLSLCIVGAVFPGHTPNLLQTRSPSVTAERVVAALASARLPDPAMQDSTQEPRPCFERVAVRSPAMTGKDTPSTSLPPRDSQSAPLPTTSEGSETTPPSSPEEANWVVVIRWATVHSGPSVSARTVRFYSVGTELHLIGYWDGWFQVLDAASRAARARVVRARLDLCEVLSSSHSGAWPGYCRLASAGKGSTKSG